MKGINRHILLPTSKILSHTICPSTSSIPSISFRKKSSRPLNIPRNLPEHHLSLSHFLFIRARKEKLEKEIDYLAFLLNNCITYFQNVKYDVLKQESVLTTLTSTYHAYQKLYTNSWQGAKHSLSSMQSSLVNQNRLLLALPCNK